MENICCIVSLQGFNVGRKFLTREFGWIKTASDETGNVRFDLRPHESRLTEKDKSTLRFTTNNLHGLQFLPVKGEDVVPVDSLASKITEIYNGSKDDSKNVIAYKGGSAIKDILKKLKIPCVNLEDFGCPKYPELKEYHCSKNCGYHQKLQCTLQEVDAYKSWVMNNKHQFTVEDNEEEDDDEEDY